MHFLNAFYRYLGISSKSDIRVPCFFLLFELKNVLVVIIVVIYLRTIRNINYVTLTILSAPLRDFQFSTRNNCHGTAYFRKDCIEVAMITFIYYIFIVSVFGRTL